MTDHEDDYGIGKPIDDEYIDVEAERADVSTTEQESESDEIDTHSETSRHADTDVSYRLDISRGAGASAAIDDIIDESAVIDHDGRADTRTFYYVNEAPASMQHRFQRMLRWQEGENDSERDVKNNEADRNRYAETFCSNLDMSSYHTERVKLIHDSLPHANIGPYSSQKVCLGIVSIVANEDGRFVRDEDGFRDLVRAVDADLVEIRRIRRMIKEKSDML